MRSIRQRTARPRSAEAGWEGSLEVARLYVALKTKPMAILCGPAGSGKQAAARALGHLLATPRGTCFHEMVGHAWWANRSPGVSVFTEAQHRFNCDKIAAIVGEAAESRCAGRVFVVLLSRISPAEWDLLAALAGPLSGGTGATGGEVVLIATLDGNDRGPWPEDLLRAASLFTWTPRGPTRGLPLDSPNGSLAWRTGFARAHLREPRDALGLLRSLAGWEDGMTRPLFALLRAMNGSGLRERNRAAGEALLYLANAWTRDGKPLLAPSFTANLRQGRRLAAELAIAPRLDPGGAPLRNGEALAYSALRSGVETGRSHENQAETRSEERR